MAYERGSGGAGGKSGNESFKKTLAEYTAHYNNKNGFQNKQLDDPYFNSSKPAGSTMRKTPSKSNPNRKPPPNDPYFDSRKPAGNYMGRQGPQPSYAMKEEMGWKWKEQAQWENKIRNPQAPPPGLRPPGTAPDTPNTVRQRIETSPLLSDRVKGILSTVPTKTDYSKDDSRTYNAYYEGPMNWRPGGSDNGRIVSFVDSQDMADHESIHAVQGFGTPLDIDRSQFGRDMYSDAVRLRDQGYTKFGDAIDFINKYYGSVPPSELQSYLGAAQFMNPAEIPPWYKEKYMADIWSDSAMSAPPPPRPMSPPISAPPVPAPSVSPTTPSRMAKVMNNFSSGKSMRDLYLEEIRAQAKYPVRWR